MIYLLQCRMYDYLFLQEVFTSVEKAEEFVKNNPQYKDKDNTWSLSLLELNPTKETRTEFVKMNI